MCETEIDLDGGIVVLQVDEVFVPTVVVLHVVVWVLIIVAWSLGISEVIRAVTCDAPVISVVEILEKVVDLAPMWVDSEDIIDIGITVEIFSYSTFSVVVSSWDDCLFKVVISKVGVVIGMEAIKVVFMSVIIPKFDSVISDEIILLVICVVTSPAVSVVVDIENISDGVIVGFLRVINFLVVNSNFLVVFICWFEVSNSIGIDFWEVDIIVDDSKFIWSVVDELVVLVENTEGIEVELEDTVFNDGLVIGEIDEAEDIWV